jgi:ABC-type sugar transport system substrate-binding protein
MRHFLLPLLALSLMVLIGGCQKTSGTGESGASTQASNGSGKTITVAMLPKKKGVPYFSTCADGAEACAKELGNVHLIYDGPTDGSAEKAASMIEKWTLQGVDVIAVSPNDPDVVAPAMKNARAKGVHVITWDSDSAPDTREFFVNQATAEQIGNTLVDTLAGDIAAAAGQKDPKQAKGQVAIISATLTAANQNTWMKYMNQRLKEYPGLELVATKPTKEDQKHAIHTPQDQKKANPNLKGIWGISSVSFPGAAEAVRQAGKSGQVQVTGLGTPNSMKEFVKDGTVRSVILWNTKDLGYLTIQVAEQLATGKLKPGAKSINAGRLGEKKIDGDNVLLGNILIFTKENIDQYDF